MLASAKTQMQCKVERSELPKKYTYKNVHNGGIRAA